MKKINVLLCGIGAACILTGCGTTVELTEEENEVITEYAVSLLLKYDKNYNNHLVDLTLYEEEQDSLQEEMPKEDVVPEQEEPLPEENQESETVDTTVADAEEEVPISSIEEFYGIPGFTFQYTGYDIAMQYPEMTENTADAFFAMEASPGTQLLILKFQAINQSGVESELNMMDYNTKIKVSVNGEASKFALSTMLLNDLQTYRGSIGAYELAELVAIVEVPAGTPVNNISLILRGDADNATLPLQ